MMRRRRICRGQEGLASIVGGITGLGVGCGGILLSPDQTGKVPDQVFFPHSGQGRIASAAVVCGGRSCVAMKALLGSRGFPAALVGSPLLVAAPLGGLGGPRMLGKEGGRVPDSDRPISPASGKLSSLRMNVQAVNGRFLGSPQALQEREGFNGALLALLVGVRILPFLGLFVRGEHPGRRGRGIPRATWSPWSYAGARVDYPHGDFGHHHLRLAG